MNSEVTQITTKQCSKCHVTNTLEHFGIDKSRLDGLKPWCKQCCRNYDKSLRQASLEKFRARARESYYKNKEKRAAYHAEYYHKNKAKIYAKSREWIKSHPDRIKAYYSTPEAKEARRLLKREWDRKRAADPVFRISNNVRTSMYHALKGKKGFRKWETLVGYTLEDLIKHLAPQLKDGMTWDNYGETWQIDHITPKSWFKYDSAEHPSFKACWSLANLQPMLKVENIRKGNRFKG